MTTLDELFEDKEKENGESGGTVEIDDSDLIFNDEKLEKAEPDIKKYDESQPRANDGKWTDGGGGNPLKTESFNDYKTRIKQLSSEELQNSFDDLVKDKKGGGSLLDEYARESYFPLDDIVTEYWGNPESARPKNGRERITYEGKDREKAIEEVRKMKLTTQEYLRKTYGDEITVYRGVGSKTKEKFSGLNEQDTIELNTYNVSSWSSSKQIAEDFASRPGGGIVISTTVPVENVLVHHDLWKSHPDFENEQEVILIGNKYDGILEKIV